MGITLRNLCKSSDLKEVITKSELKNKRLWTDKLIEDYLIPLDDDVASRYSFMFNTMPILFYKDDVFHIEATSSFQLDFDSVNRHGEDKHYKSNEILQETIKDSYVLYIHESALSMVVTRYIDEFIKAHPEYISYATVDTQFTDRIKRKVIKELFSSYLNDIKILMKCKANVKQMRTYTKHMDDEITRIYFNGGNDDTEVH